MTKFVPYLTEEVIEDDAVALIRARDFEQSRPPAPSAPREQAPARR